MPVPSAAGGPSGITDSDGFYLVVVVQPSPRAPHAVLGDPGDNKHPLRFPVRHGADTVWLTESEVADRYRRRLDALAQGNARAEAVVDEGRQVLRRAAGVWLYVAAMPEVPLVATLDAAAVAAARSWADKSTLSSPLNRTLLAFTAAISAPGRTTFTGLPYADSDEAGDPRGSYVELHVDGSAFAATPIVERTTDAGERQVGVRTLADDLAVVVDAVLGWTLHQAGSGGPVRLVAGLVDSDSDDLKQFTGPVELARAHHGGRLRRVNGSRVLRRAPQVTTTALVGDVDDLQSRLAVVGTVHSLLLQWFGHAESAQIGRDGALLTAGWEPDGRQVARWAADHGVAFR